MRSSAVYREWKRREAMRRELLRLTDRELADVGISRTDIDRIVPHEITEMSG